MATRQRRQSRRKTRTKRIRLVHGLDLYWCRFHKTVYKEASPPNIPSDACGGRPHRRREEGMLLLRLTATKLRKAKRSFAVISADMQNAFGSTTHEAMNNETIPHFSPEDATFVETRRDNLIATVSACDGDIDFHCLGGGFQGDTVAGEEFCDTYHEQLRPWRYEMVEKLNTCESPICSPTYPEPFDFTTHPSKPSSTTWHLSRTSAKWTPTPLHTFLLRPTTNWTNTYSRLGLYKIAVSRRWHLACVNTQATDVFTNTLDWAKSSPPW